MSTVSRAANLHDHCPSCLHKLARASATAGECCEDCDEAGLADPMT